MMPSWTFGDVLVVPMPPLSYCTRARTRERERERDHWDLTIAAYYDYDAGHGQRQGGGDSSTDRPTALSPGLRAYPTQT